MDEAETPLDVYLREIDATKLLTRDQEVDLAKRIEDGDYEARDHLTRANLRLVVRIARDFVGKGLALEDLIAEGNLGLMRAVEGFDHRMGNRFSTYAGYWIKQSIKRALMNTGRQVRVPAYMLELVAKWRAVARAIEADTGKTASPRAIARRLKIPPAQIDGIVKAITALGEKLGAEELAEHGADVQEPIDLVARTESAGLVRKALARLRPYSARSLLRLRFGFEASGPVELAKAAEMLGIPARKAARLEAIGLRRLWRALGHSQGPASDSAW